MFAISDEMIKGMCYNQDIYNRGLRYYKEGRVKDVVIDNGEVHAIVSGNDYYYVTLSLLPGDGIESADCECPAYSQYPGYCKHIIAVLLYLKDAANTPPSRREKNNIIYNRDKIVSNEILNYFDSEIYSTVKQPVNLEITLEFQYDGKYSEDLIPAVYMRMGIERLYLVRNIKNLIEMIMRGIPIEFGKQFTFDPAINFFREQDIPIMNFVMEMYNIDKTIEQYSRYNYGVGSLFKGKYLSLPRISLGRFLNILESRSLRFSIGQDLYENVKIINEDIPVDFFLKKSGDNLVLDVDIPKTVFLITDDGQYMFCDGNIYKISNTQQDNLMPFYNATADGGTENIRFAQKDREKFVSMVLPNIKKAGRLTMDSSIDELFYERPLDAEVYLDKIDDIITANFKFRYGDYEIDPFDEEEHSTKDAILIRDYSKEREIIGVFEQCSFKINKDKIYLDNDDKIYGFISEHIPELQKICAVYYSESFKGIKVYNSSYYRGSVRFSSELDLLEFSFSIDGIDKESLPEVFDALKKKKRYYRLEDGSFLPLDTPELENMSNIIEYMDIKDDEISRDVLTLSKFKAMYLDDALGEFNSDNIERNYEFKRLVDSITHPKDMEFEVPAELTGIMRGYQITGFKWLKSLASYGLGGILADDMGLGKTLQTIAFLLSEKKSTNLPSIVICPTSVIYNWENEIQKFAPSLKSLIISGGKDERLKKLKDIKDADIIITSYPLIRRDIDLYKDISFAYCILDEAQYIKNANSVNAQSVKEIFAKGYFALTGTPIENNLAELWSIFDFIMPGYLLSYSKFNQKFERPIANRSDQALKQLNRHIKPFILRRLKRDVLKELPPKIESVITADLTNDQKKIYLAYLQQIKGSIEENIREKGFDRSRIQILAGLTRLRQICCHPSLFIENYNGKSGKLDSLLEMLEELREGKHRVLLFSQFTGALKLISEVLVKKGISYFYLDGHTKSEDRMDMIEAFNRGFRDIFLISLKAGGTGLNLTGADTVIHFDPWWNPAVEDQATDRAYRIGQENTVQVIKLITKGTVEEKIIALQQKKKELINSVLKPGETFITKMTEEDIRDLFNINI